MTGDKNMAPLPPKPPSKEDQAYIKELIEGGKIKPVIDRRYSLGELPEALSYLGRGYARGKVVITVLD